MWYSNLVKSQVSIKRDILEMFTVGEKEEKLLSILSDIGLMKTSSV